MYNLQWLNRENMLTWSQKIISISNKSLSTNDSVDRMDEMKGVGQEETFFPQRHF